MAAKDTEEKKSDEQDVDLALDMSQTAVKKMIAEARDRGYITYDQLNNVLPPDQVSSEQIEDVMSMLSEMGINIIEDDEAEDEEESLNTTVVSLNPEEFDSDAQLMASIWNMFNREQRRLDVSRRSTNRSQNNRLGSTFRFSTVSQRKSTRAQSQKLN